MSDSNEAKFSTGLGTQETAYYTPKKIGETHQIAFGDMSQTFTGADITALIIRRDDQLLLRRAADYLNALEEQAEALKNPYPSADYIANINQSSDLGVSTSERSSFTQDADQINLIKAQQAIINGNCLTESLNKSTNYDTESVFPIVNLQAVTVSTFRAKRQVRALGHVNPKGVVRGTRTCGGTIILTEFDRDSFWKLITAVNPVPGADLNIGDNGSAVLPDQLAPFDLLLMFANEAGNLAYRIIYEIELVTNGVVYSVQDMYNESTLSFLCTDVTPLIPLPPIISRGGALMGEALLIGEGKTVRISPLSVIQSGSEVARRFRFLKNSRFTNR